MITCSASSHASGEQLFATATRADYWFVLEHPQTFGNRALVESGLPENVIRHLETAASQVPNGRVQLIKHSSAVPADGPTFFVVVNHEEQPNLYEFHLDRVEDLLDLDLLAIAREDLAYRHHDRQAPIYLVCTNGRRDPCCSSLGLPLYREMRARFGDAVWQAAHIGGHRFAPALVVLPSGANYGYVSPEALDDIVKATTSGRIHLPNYRGRSCYAAHIQAADTFLRRHTGLDDVLQFKLIEAEPIEENRWMLQFKDRRTQRDYCVRLRSIPGAVNVLKSCREAAEVSISQFVAEEVQIF